MPFVATFKPRADREREANAAANGQPGKPAARSTEAPSLTERGIAKIARDAGAGQPVPDGVRERLEPALGANLGGARLHSDGRAHALTRSIGANALTVGNDVFFAPGLDPVAPPNAGLLAHELTHVAQPRGEGEVDADLAMSLPVPLGGFEIDMTDLIAATPGASAGMSGTIQFIPDPHAPYSADIELLQIVNTLDVAGLSGPKGAPYNYGGSGEAPRNTVMTTGKGAAPAGWFVDQVYDPASAATPTSHTASSATGPYYQNHYGYTASNQPGWVRSPTDVKASTLWDAPAFGNDLDYEFETVAKGVDNQQTYGSLEWGFKIRGGRPTAEYARATGAASPNVDEALDRFRTYFTHEPTIIYFDTDVDTPTTLTAEGAKLDEAATWLAAHSDATVTIEGFADETGPAGHNVALSNRRANSVAGELLRRGLPATRITTVTGHGMTHSFGGGAPGTGVFAAQPGHPATDAGTLRANRRVVITFVRTAITPPAP